MQKKLCAIVLTLVLMFSLYSGAYAAGTAEKAVPAQASSFSERIEMPSFDVAAKNAILMCADTGDVLYIKNPDEAVAIASITKVMTLLLTFEALDAGKIKLDDIVPVSTHAFNMGGSQIWLEPGEQFTLDEMLKAICVSSANDAAVAVAEFVGGSEDVFAQMMNAKAQQLGMTNSNFLNACGLDQEGHLSSARDVAIMSRELMKHKDVFKYTTIWMDSLRGGETQLVNTNNLLKHYGGTTGLKTGTTGRAGVCISATAQRENTNLIAVVLGCDNKQTRYNAATSLLDYGFATYEVADFPAIDGFVQSLPVKNGSVQEIALSYAVPQKLLLKKGEAVQLTVDTALPENVKAPFEKGAQLGEISVSINGTVIEKYPITASVSVEKMNFKMGMSLLLKGLFTM